MNNEMANFIGIHMLNDGQQDEDNKQDEEGGLTYQCPETGSHFEFMDLIGRMRNLKQKRNVQQPVKWSSSGKSYQSLSFESIKEVYGLICALKNLVGYICSHIFSALTALYRGSGEITLFKVK